MEKKLVHPNQPYQDLDKLIQENLNLSMKLHTSKKDVGKLKLAVTRLETEYSTLIGKLEKSNARDR
jgi:hypothetical protein